jgi:hypothetical protein
MNYQEMSNEQLRQVLREKFPGVSFKEVAEYNRQTVIALLKIHQNETRRPGSVQSED